MLFRTSIAKKILWLLVFFAVPLPLAAFAQSDSFNSLWHTAAETVKRKANLEQSLASFDGKVSEAKKELLRAATDRRDTRLQIESRQKLIAVLQEQLHAAAESRGFYESLATEQKDDIIFFIRYLSGRQIARSESGPSIGGPILKTMLRGTLGESVERSLGEQAMLLARQHFALQINVLVSEADRAQIRIRTVLDDLQSQVDGLEEHGKDLGSTMEETIALIDNSWRQKKLNEEELRHVVQETAEANSKINEMQSSLLRINSELKASSVVRLKGELEKLHADQTALSDQKIELERKDQAMSLLQDSAQKAVETATTLRNSDPKIFRRIEDAQLRLKQLEIDEVDASQIDQLKQQIALMKTGVPEAAAADVIRSQHQALEATDARRDIAAQIDGLTQKIAALQESIPAKKQELETAERAAAEQAIEVASLPPVFSWPVHGSITAGYFDPDYFKVFGVPHRAIDIAVPQATPIHTVSQGIVFAVKDGGRTGYSYILVGHEGGYASLYGHVSASFVKAGDKVAYGQIIGLTGGEPGSHGAGHMTTGAHLHLEMMKNGVHLSPLGVLQ